MAARTGDGVVAVTARIVTNDKSFDASNRKVDFDVTTPDGTKRSFSSVTDGDGVAPLAVRFPPAPAIASLPLDLTDAGLPIEAAERSLLKSSHPTCELVGGVTVIAICAGATLVGIASLAVPAGSPPILIGAGAIISDAPVNGAIVVGSCVAMEKAFNVLTKPQPMAADGNSSGETAGGKDDAFQGESGDPNFHLPPDDPNNPNRNTRKDRELTDREIRKLSEAIKKDGIENVEELKSGGRNAGKYQLYVDENGNVYTKLKPPAGAPPSGNGAGTFTGYNLNALPK